MKEDKNTVTEQNLEIISYSPEEIGTVYELIDRKNYLPKLKLIE